MSRLRVLCVFEQCNPEWASVPLVAYNLWNALTELVDVTLATHARNRKAMEKIRNGRTVAYIEESGLMAWYFRLISRLTARGVTNWPLFHALSYPVYAQFNRRVHDRFAREVESGAYDVVHAMTPILPRYPVALAQLCCSTPLVLGPVNGGLPFPDGFRDVERKEFAAFNFLRGATRFIPGYAATYRAARVVLAGSRYTGEMLRERFPEIAERIVLFHENGLTPAFFQQQRDRGKEEGLRVLFVGRLVAYKGADMLLEAVAESGLPDIRVTVVGDGPERGRLEALSEQLGLAGRTIFTGWIAQHETTARYAEADLFCFPSIREFGGAVVLEAMASGAPCVVADHGGIGEYVDESCGVKVAPTSRRDMVTGFARVLRELRHDPERLAALSRGAVERARGYTWENKARLMLEHFQRAIATGEREP